MSRTSDVVFRFDPLNNTQKEAIELFDKSRIIFLLGPAGTGKSYLSMGLALKSYFEKKISKIYLVRPIVEACEERVGFLPGTLDEKVEVYLQPFRQAISKLVYGNLPKDLLQPTPLAFLRGFNFESCVAVLDEAQSCSFGQLKLFISRLGKNSKLIITGDSSQIDRFHPCAEGYECPLDEIADRLETHPSVSIIDFTEKEIVRDKILASILERLN